MENKTYNYNLFLDDVREPYDAFLYTKDTDFSKLKWTVVRNYEEFVKVISENYENGSFPAIIAFDHDLADEHYEHLAGTIPYNEMEEKTGMHCATWLVDFCIDNKMKLPIFKVHSMNPAGRANIKGLLENYKKHEDSHNG
jgi:hypothetical protein